jgi:hypothetical protein
MKRELRSDGEERLLGKGLFGARALALVISGALAKP